jgi:SET domain-containing protein
MDMLEEVINHLSNNIKTKLGISKIDGIGVFAIKDINKNDDVFIPWKYESGMYIIPNDRLNDIPNEVRQLIDMYFINDECGYKIIRLFKGFNFLFHGTSYCNSAYPIESNINISTKGIALRDIKAGEEILEWYVENLNLDNSK